MNTTPTINAMVIREDTRFEPGIYLIPDGIEIAADGITLDGNGAHLIGQRKSNAAIHLKGVNQVTIKNIQLSGFHRGIEAQDCQELTIKNCRVRDCIVNPQTKKKPSAAHSGDGISCGIFLAGVSNSEVLTNDLQCQANGLAAFACHKIRVKGNNLSHQPGFGLILNDTSFSKIEDNLANHCGTDSSPLFQTEPLPETKAGVLLLNGSSNNRFTGNQARLCINGFLIEPPSLLSQGSSCNSNHFENNDASHCILAGFTDSLSDQNRYIHNQAHYNTIGFSLTRSKEIILENNSLLGNARAGIAAENCALSDAVHNTLQDNRFGMLLWSRPDPKSESGQKEIVTSEFWEIRDNSFLRNHTGIRIAADQIAGLTPINPALTGQIPHPHDHEIMQNVFSNNRLGIQTQDVDRTVIKNNQFELNLLGDIKS